MVYINKVLFVVEKYVRFFLIFIFLKIWVGIWYEFDVIIFLGRKNCFFFVDLGLGLNFCEVDYVVL